MNIKLRILQALKLTDPQRYEKWQLQDQLSYQSRRKIGDTEMQTALNELKAKGLIDYEVDDLTGDTRYYITHEGKAKLQ
jgi:DNA-binding PadR family transcriptional regulator